MGVTQVFSNSRVFVLEKLSADIADIIHITQITFEFIDNAFIVVDLFSNGGLASATFMSSAIFLFVNTGCRSLFILYTTRFLHTILVFKDRPRI